MHYTSEVEFRAVPDFDEYVISSDGRVINIKTDRELVFTPTQNGEYTVGMMGGYPRKQFRRSVKVLVAEAFVPGKTEEFDTPILLDGNRRNLDSYNILWRPRWFAHKYSSQFNEPIPSWYYVGPIIDIKDRMEYQNIFEAAITNGCLCEDIHESILHGRLVFPTGSRFTNI